MTCSDRPRWARIALGSLVAAGVVVGAGCGSQEVDEAVVPDSGELAYVADQLPGSGGENGYSIAPPLSASQLLPNVEVKDPFTGTWHAAVDSVVVGRPAEVELSRSVAWDIDQPDPETDEPAMVDLALGDPRAMIHFWEVTVAIEEVVGGPALAEVLDQGLKGQVQVLVSSAGGEVDIERFRSGVAGLGRSVWFLASQTGVPNMPDRFRLSWDNTAVATVRPSGELSFPLVGEEHFQAAHHEDVTLQDLRRLADQPTTRIEGIDLTAEAPPEAAGGR